MSEFGFPTDTPIARTTFELIAEKADASRLHRHPGMLDPELPGRTATTSWAHLKTAGKVAGKYRISQYGGSKELPVFSTDFGIIGLMVCGDIYSPEICRAMGVWRRRSSSAGRSRGDLQGTQSLDARDAVPSTTASTWPTAHFPTSDGQRSYVIDPFMDRCSRRFPLTKREGVASADVDPRCRQSGSPARQTPAGRAVPGWPRAGYYGKSVPKVEDLTSAPCSAPAAGPELYRAIVEQTLAGRDIPPAVQTRMHNPGLE